jgi:hypothetical protein
MEQDCIIRTCIYERVEAGKPPKKLLRMPARGVCGRFDLLSNKLWMSLK